MSEPRRVFVYPHYANNPWQGLMYSGLDPEEFHTVPIASLDELPTEARAAEDSVLHLNWTAAISQSVPSLVESFGAVASAMGRLEAYQRAGGRIVWTIHNALPHEVFYLGPEIELCRWLCDRVDAITVMNPDTARLVAHLYLLPAEKTRVLSHPSYPDAQASTVTRAQARSELGLAEAERVALFFGMLRPYKGIERLLASLTRADHHADEPTRLMIAGARGPGYTEADITTLLGARDDVSAYVEHVSDERADLLFAACDLVVLPYRGGLNSGVVYLAASYGRPVLVPQIRENTHLLSEPWVFPITEPSEAPFAESLSQALEHAVSERAELEAAARAFAEPRAAIRVSTDFAEILRG